MQDADFPILNLGFDDSEFNKLMGGMDYVKEDNFYVDAELQKPSNADYEKFGAEIYRLREEKQKAQLENLGRDELEKRLADMVAFLREQHTSLIDYDEALYAEYFCVECHFSLRACTILFLG